MGIESGPRPHYSHAGRIWHWLLVVIALLFFVSGLVGLVENACGQELGPSMPMVAGIGSSFIIPSPENVERPMPSQYPKLFRPQHRFLDRTGSILIGAQLTFAGLDAWRTWWNVCNPSWVKCADTPNEKNPFLRPFVTSRSAGMLAVGFGLQTGAEVGLEYLWHRTGHHRLERVTQLVSIGFSVEGFGYSLKHSGIGK